MDQNLALAEVVQKKRPKNEAKMNVSKRSFFEPFLDFVLF